MESAPSVRSRRMRDVMVSWPRSLLMLLLPVASLTGCDDLADDEAADPCSAGRDLVACGERTPQLSSRPLAGYVGGQPWFFGHGHAILLDTEDDPAFIAQLYEGDYTPCADRDPMGVSHLLADLPLTAGTYSLSDSRNLTFVNYDAEGELQANVMAFSGQLVIEEITSQSITGSLYSRAGEGQEVNGRFSLTVCP